MLQAICNGKSRLYQRYLGHREEGEGRVSEEDEITSLIMGPLEYLPPAQVTEFWRAVVEHECSTATLFPVGAAEQVKMNFWLRRSIEPDLFVELIWGNGERRLLLVEFKWRAPLSGNDQLHRQWREFLTAEERRDACHLFIAPDISAGLNAKSEQDIWGGKLLLRSWLSILYVLRSLSCYGSPGMQTWVSQVAALLSKLGIARFQGFSHLTAPKEVSRSPVFWSPLSGFITITPMPSASGIENSSSIFWSTKP